LAQTQQQRRADTRARLVDAATALFAEQGIDAVSIDAVADAAGRTSGAVYDHFGSKQGLLLALLDSWKDSLLTVLAAQVAVSDSAEEQLAAVWDNVATGGDDRADRMPLLEHELWLRAARDPDVAEVLRVRSAEGRRYSARQLAAWSSAVGAAPVAGPEELAVLVKALLTGLVMQQRLDPGTVDADLAVRGLAALLGLPVTSASAPAPVSPSTASSPTTPTSVATPSHPSTPPNTPSEESHHEH
jgi:AcrR family transcriptional regulator